MPYKPDENITMEEHYLRNNLNIQYEWDDFQKLQNQLPENLKWKKLTSTQSLFHKFGQGNNRKYVSACEHFEAVYTKENYLVDEKFSAMNMGTYNYYGPSQTELHAKVDVETWGKWGNTEKGWIWSKVFK